MASSAQPLTPIVKEKGSPARKCADDEVRGPLSRSTRTQVIAHLAKAAAAFHSVSLTQSAKWASEHWMVLNELERKERGEAKRSEEEAAGGDISEPVEDLFDSKDDELRWSEEPVMNLALSYVHLKEFDRATHAIVSSVAASPSASTPSAVLSSSTCDMSLRLRFLKCYAQYLAGEKRKYERVQELSPEDQTGSVMNPNLSALRAELEQVVAHYAMNARATSSPPRHSRAWGRLLYLYGVVLAEQKMKEEASKALLDACFADPLNWSCWVALSSTCDSTDNLNALQHSQQLKQISDGPFGFMVTFFEGYVALELQMSSAAQELFDQLYRIFPTSTFVIAHIATALYNLRDDEASTWFQMLRDADPFRLENIDTYSNILYVREKKEELSFLAHQAVTIDKYRPETCCIIGNYYSLKGEHQRAVVYFKRALKLDAKFLSAWTLMGHEYIEIKNFDAAIHAYRQAVDIDPRDYRAWYGLGQTYELLKMLKYSLYYFGKAAQLRPYDGRMWLAIGDCYDHLGLPKSAIQAMERAEAVGDSEYVVIRLARLYNDIKDDDKAAEYYVKAVEQADAKKEEDEDLIQALVFLSRYYLRKGNDELVMKYCHRLLEYSGKEKEYAKRTLASLHTSAEQ